LFDNVVLSLKLGRFLDLEVNDQSTVTVTSEEFRDVLEYAIRGLARSRYQKAVGKKGVLDPDYDPDLE
jgi:hypothetical protein